MAQSQVNAQPAQRKATQFKDHSKVDQVRKSNLIAAKSVADAVRTSLGPRGMDKMIQSADGSVIITNDGATILKHMSVIHPAAKMLVDLSAAQDVEAGDGTTSVVVLCGALLVEAEKLLAKGIHPTIIAESFSLAAEEAVHHLESVAKPIDLKDRDTLIKAASTSLSSKVVSQYSQLLAPLSVDAVLKVVGENGFIDLRDIRTVKKIGGTMDDTHLVDGIVLNQKISRSAGGPVRVEKAKIALIQFQVSPPKPDVIFFDIDG
eukprot:NODE_181_length_13917_cov_0.838110.p9 type:complete len:262 gc:universal NODE_181_length_13917_cov_0.838110:5870-6655(+)